MKLDAVRVLGGFLWLQTLSLLTERLQSSAIEPVFDLISAAFLAHFMAVLAQGIPVFARWIAVLTGLLLVQLSLPAVVYFSATNDSRWLYDVAKLAAWQITLLYSIKVHDSEERVRRTLRTVQACGLTVAGTLTVASVLRWGEPAYNIGLLHLGGIQSEAAVAMFAVALLQAFFVDIGDRWRLGVLGWLVVLIGLLLKRSAIVVAATGLLLGLRFVTKNRIVARFVVFVVVPTSTALILAQPGYRGALLESSVVSERMEDIRKMRQYDDVRYLGSGRVGLVGEHLAAFASRGRAEQWFGVFKTSERVESGPGYLNTGLRTEPHNDVLEVLHRAGLVGVLVYLAYLGAVGQFVRSCRTPASGIFWDSLRYCTGGAALIYLVHVVIGVVFKVQFMIVISVLVGLRAAMRPSPALSDMNHQS